MHDYCPVLTGGMYDNCTVLIGGMYDICFVLIGGMHDDCTVLTGGMCHVEVTTYRFTRTMTTAVEFCCCRELLCL